MSSKSSPSSLNGHQARFFVALANATFPGDTQFTVPVDPEDLSHRLASVFSAMPALTRFGVDLFVRAFNWLASFVLPTLCTYCRPRENPWVNAWIESRLVTRRFIARALLTLVKPTHIGRRAVQAEMNYPVDRLRLVEPSPPIVLDSKHHRETLDHDESIRTQVVIIGTGAGGGWFVLAEKGIDVLLEARSWHDPAHFGKIRHVISKKCI